MVLGLVGTGAVSTELDPKGTHRRAVAISPTPRADGDPDARSRSEECEFSPAEHKAVALEAAEVFTAAGVIDVEEHRTGVQ